MFGLRCTTCSISSATWPSAVRRLAQSYLKEPMIVCVGTLDLVVSSFFITINSDIMEILIALCSGMSTLLAP